ncbi:MAG: hypothetical protein H6741_27490 [Alphaproteobacteria bacterium]|nr:hypothetical protein [Alphaproteobacteria bacterium]MCB9796457.1 hypothetical protein [Alphaproteobacteria bacterium]
MISIAWAILSVGCAPACGDVALLEQRECAVEALIETIDANHPRDFIERKGLDLEALYAEWRGLPAEHEEREEFIFALHHGVAQLQDAHTGLLAPGAAYLLSDGRARLIDGEVIIARPPSGAPTMLPGDVVLEVAGVPVEELLETATARGSSVAAQAHNRALDLLTPRREYPAPIRVRRGRVELEVTMEGRGVSDENAVNLHVELDGVDTLRISSFEFPEMLAWIDARMDVALDDEALIIDLRGNGGGYAWLADSLLGRLFETPPPDYPVLDTEGEPLLFGGRLVKRGEAYTGPLAILVDADTASAANYVAHRIRTHGRGLICGTASGGGAGLPRVQRDLAPGLTLITVDAYLIGPEGEDLELGLEPDPECAVTWTAEQLAQGLDAQQGYPAQDLALQRAIEVMSAR